MSSATPQNGSVPRRWWWASTRPGAARWQAPSSPRSCCASHVRAVSTIPRNCRPSAAARWNRRSARAAFCGLAVVELAEIDRLNIFHATMQAMTLAVTRLVDALACEPDAVLIDGNMTPHGRNPHGAGRRPGRSSAATGRTPLHRGGQHPAQGIPRPADARGGAAAPALRVERNAGYGTAEHLEALRTRGPTPLHRRSFVPVAQVDLFAESAASAA